MACMVLQAGSLVRFVVNPLHTPVCSSASHTISVQNFQSILFPDTYAQYNGDSTDNPTANRYFIFTISEFRQAIELQMDRYWSIGMYGLVDIGIPVPVSDGIVADPVSVPFPLVSSIHFVTPVEKLRDPTIAPDVSTDVITHTIMSTDDYYPVSGLNDTELKDFLASVSTITYTFVLRVSDSTADGGAVTPYGCRDWQMDIVYDFSHRHHFEVTWDFTMLQRCPSGGTTHAGLLTLMSLSVALILIYEAHNIVSAMSLAFRFRRAYAKQEEILSKAPLNKNYGPNGPRIGTRQEEDGSESLILWPTKEEERAERAAEKRRQAEKELNDSSVNGRSPLLSPLNSSAIMSSESSSTSSSSSSDSCEAGSIRRLHKLKRADTLSLLRPWAIVGSIGDALLLTYCFFMYAAEADVPGSFAAVLLAIAAACIVLSLLRYLDFSPGLYSTMLTIRGSGKGILKFLFGSTPLFIALGFFALIAFNDTVRYSNPTMAFMTIYAFFNGDALRETLTHTEQTGNAYRTVIGDVYLVLLVILFTYVVSNCAVGLVEEAFFETRTAAAQNLVREALMAKIHIRQAIESLTTHPPRGVPGLASPLRRGDDRSDTFEVRSTGMRMGLLASDTLGS
jgi:hypothetical protein